MGIFQNKRLLDETRLYVILKDMGGHIWCRISDKDNKFYHRFYFILEQGTVYYDFEDKFWGIKDSDDRPKMRRSVFNSIITDLKSKIDSNKSVPNLKHLFDYVGLTGSTIMEINKKSVKAMSLNLEDYPLTKKSVEEKVFDFELRKHCYGNKVNGVDIIGYIDLMKRTGLTRQEIVRRGIEGCRFLIDLEKEFNEYYGVKTCLMPTLLRENMTVCEDDEYRYDTYKIGVEIYLKALGIG